MVHSRCAAAERRTRSSQRLVERIGKQIGRVRGDGRLVFLASGVAVADVETGEEQRHAHGGGAGVVGEQAGPGGIEAGVELGEMFERPERGIRLGEYGS